MMLTVVLGVVQLLGYSSADGTAIAFGEEREGSVVPAVFEARRLTEKDRTALKGVRTLIIENDIREIAAAAFAGASDLETVVLGEGVERLGARAFADAPKLQCVVFASRKAVDASLDTFAGAGDNLTAVYLNGYDRKVLHPSAVWTNMTRISGCVRDFVRTDLKRGVCYSGPKVTSDGWLYRVQDGEIACLTRTVGWSCPIPLGEGEGRKKTGKEECDGSHAAHYSKRRVRISAQARCRARSRGTRPA